MGNPHFYDREFPLLGTRKGTRILFAILECWFRERKGFRIRAVGNVRYDAVRVALPGFLERMPHRSDWATFRASLGPFVVLVIGLLFLLYCWFRR